MAESAPVYALLRQAAQHLRDGAPLPAGLAEALADWLDSEAVVLGEMEPFVELLNATVRHASGVETFLRFGRKADGTPAMHGDTSPAAFAVARLVLAGVHPTVHPTVVTS
jgi:hypothetical protein